MASSTATLAPERIEQRRRTGLIGLGVLWVLAYAPALLSLIGSWSDSYGDMQHGIVVPFLTAYLTWNMRAELARVPVTGTLWGLLFVVIGVLQSSISMIAEWTFLIRTGMLLTGLGCVVSVYGIRILRPLAYPLLLTLFMVAPPTFVYSAVTIRLQLLASQLAETVLEFAGYSVFREGNILEMGGMQWSVAEACSGMRSLVTLAFFFLVYNYLFVKKISVRLILLAALIPIAIFGNAMRVVLTVVVGQYDRELALGMMHEATGYVIVAVAGTICIALHQLIEKFIRHRAKQTA